MRNIFIFIATAAATGTAVVLLIWNLFFKNNLSEKPQDENKSNETQTISDKQTNTANNKVIQTELLELDKKFALEVAEFQKDYRSMREEVAYNPEYGLKTQSQATKKEVIKIGEYRILYEANKNDDSNTMVHSEPEVAIRRITINGEGFEENYILAQISAPGIKEIDGHFIMLGFNDNMSINAALRIGEPQLCFTTINLNIQDGGVELGERQYINSKCRQISKKNLFFKRNTAAKAQSSQQINNEPPSQDLSEKIGIIQIPSMKETRKNIGN